MMDASLAEVSINYLLMKHDHGIESGHLKYDCDDRHN